MPNPTVMLSDSEASKRLPNQNTAKPLNTPSNSPAREGSPLLIPPHAGNKGGCCAERHPPACHLGHPAAPWFAASLDSSLPLRMTE